MVLPTGARQGFSYTVSATVDAPRDADLLAATVPTTGAARRYLALPNLPFTLAEYARRTVADARDRWPARARGVASTWVTGVR